MMGVPADGIQKGHISLSICAEVSTGITPSLFGGRLGGKLAAIDEQGVPGDEGGFIRSKKFHCSCNLVGSPIRPIGTPPARAAFASEEPVNRPSIPVSKGPGATVL